MATTLLEGHDRALPMPANRPAPLTELADAETVQAHIVRVRLERGERARGWKIGFTNRTIWPLYDVHHPIWGPVWDSSLTLLDGTTDEMTIDRFVEPRLEPEIVFGLGRVPQNASLPALIAAIDWYAHGFEVVQSLYPGWKFTGAEAFAAQGLHGALRVGPRRPISELADPVAMLSAVRLHLACDDRPVAQGVGANVLDGPLQALAHFAAALFERGGRLAAGDVITTGTLTDAQPLRPGQHWQTCLEGVPLPGLSLTVR